VQSIKFFIKLKDLDSGRADVLTLTPNPNFDANTTQAVKNYQVAEGIYASGKATGAVNANGGVWTHICDDIGAWDGHLSPYTDATTFYNYAAPTGCSTTPAPPAPAAAVPAPAPSTGTTVGGIGAPAAGTPTPVATSSSGSGGETLPIPSSSDLALNKPCVASSVSNDGPTGVLLPCSNAFDGDTTTRWSSAYNDPQWIYVDLGATYNIQEVVLDWEVAYASTYQIQVSSDAVNWTTIYTANGTTGVNQLNVAGASGSGRYVRMYGTARGTQWGYSLWEMQVVGYTPTPAAPPVTTTPTPSPTQIPTSSRIPIPTPTPTPANPSPTAPSSGGGSTYYTTHQTIPSRSNIIMIVRSQLGETDVNPNGTLRYGVTQTDISWCAFFATWAWRQAGVDIPSYGPVSDIQAWGQVRGHWIPISSINDNKATPKIGDAAIFGTDHVGIVTSVTGHGSSSKISIISGNYGNEVRITPSIHDIAVDYPKYFSNTQNTSGTFVTGFVDPL